jgi:hypothetical protein
MTPRAQNARARAKRLIRGTAVLRKVNPSPAAPSDATVHAKVAGFAPEELTGSIVQGDKKLIVLAEDVETAAAAGWPAPPRDGYQVLIEGRPARIAFVDDWTRRVDGTLIAYVMAARG